MTKITSQNKAQHLVAGKNVLLMNNPDCESEAVLKIKREAADCLYLIFHDIFAPRPGLVHPEKRHVKQALDWAKDKDLDELICVCQAGISRSSAMAYVLNAAVVGPEKAIEVLDPEWHVPNLLIVKLGAEILEDPNILQVYSDYLSRRNEAIDSEIPLEIIEHAGQEVDCEGIYRARCRD